MGHRCFILLNGHDSIAPSDLTLYCWGRVWNEYRHRNLFEGPVARTIYRFSSFFNPVMGCIELPQLAVRKQLR